jgi:hypothetical protein
MWYSADASHLNSRLLQLRHYLTRIILEHFCFNRRSAATTSLRPSGSPFGPSPYCASTHRLLTAPRSGLATRLSDFATNRLELCGLAVSALFVVGALADPCGAQTPSPAPAPPSVQNQPVQPLQVTPSAGVSGQANVGPTSVPTPGVGSTTSSSAGKRFGSAGQGLPGMPGGPPINGALGSQDPSSQYMRPLVIPPLLCDPAVNIPC